MEKNSNIKLISQLALAAAGISIFIAILILLNYWHINKNKPLESQSMIALIDRLSQEPNNDALKIEIRNLDLLARKAYFTSQWQVKTGGFLLLFASIILVLLLKILYDMKKKIELPEGDTEQGLIDRLLSRRWIGAIGILVIIGALAASFASNDYLKKYIIAGGEPEKPSAVDENIKVIEITSMDTSSSEPVKEVPDENDLAPDNQDNEAIASNETYNTSTGSFPGLSEIKKQHNGFRGPLGQGISYHKNIPVDWDGPSGKNILWKVETPKAGNNSPVIWSDKIFIAGGDVQSRWVYCYDRNSGKLIWEHEAKDIEGSPAAAPKVTPDTGLSAPSLATDGERVYAIFGTGDILALDMSGKHLWARNLGVPDNHYGHSSSLLCWEGKLVVQYDTNRSGRILALNVLDGNFLWDVQRKVKISWSSPVLAKIGEQYQILTTSDPLVIAHDLTSGKELWSVECMMGEVGPSVAFSDGLVYASNEYARLVAIKPGVGSAEIVWEDDEYLPEASSPLAANGLLFLGTSYGVFACYDAKTGVKQWEHECKTGFFGSPMVADGKVYVVDMSGVTHIYELSREFKLIGEPKLGEKSVVTPAFAEGRIYLRGSKYLYCIGG